MSLLLFAIGVTLIVVLTIAIRHEQRMVKLRRADSERRHRANQARGAAAIEEGERIMKSFQEKVSQPYDDFKASR